MIPKRSPVLVRAAVQAGAFVLCGTLMFFCLVVPDRREPPFGAMCCSTVLVFVGIALFLQHWREHRESRYASHLREAASLDALVLHRVSLALPAALRARFADLANGDAPVETLLDRVAAQLAPGARYSYSAELLPRGAAVHDAHALAVSALRDRERGTAAGNYRDEARPSRATAGDSGLIVVSVVFVAFPTGLELPRVRNLAEARALRDAAVPIRPSHTRVATLVLTPPLEGSFDESTLSETFPELAPLQS